MFLLYRQESSCVYFTSLRVHNWNRCTSTFKEFSHCFSDLKGECYYSWKCEMEVSIVVSVKEIVYHKEYYIPEQIVKINATTEDLKDAWIMVPTVYHFHCVILQVL